MAIVKIVGKPKNISTEELRAMCVASASIMEFHNHRLHENKDRFTVKVVDRDDVNGKSAIGDADRPNHVIRVVSRLDHDDMFTVVVHEVIHLYKEMGYGCTEKCTSTLNSKLKSDIAKIYDVLIDGVYKRAGYIAHTKIAYKPKGKDHYDSGEHEVVPLSQTGTKYRSAKA